MLDDVECAFDVACPWRSAISRAYLRFVHLPLPHPSPATRSPRTPRPPSTPLPLPYAPSSTCPSPSVPSPTCPLLPHRRPRRRPLCRHPIHHSRRSPRRLRRQLQRHLEMSTRSYARVRGPLFRALRPSPHDRCRQRRRHHPLPRTAQMPLPPPPRRRSEKPRPRCCMHLLRAPLRAAESTPCSARLNVWQVSLPQRSLRPRSPRRATPLPLSLRPPPRQPRRHCPPAASVLYRRRRTLRRANTPRPGGANITVPRRWPPRDQGNRHQCHCQMKLKGHWHSPRAAPPMRW